MTDLWVLLILASLGVVPIFFAALIALAGIAHRVGFHVGRRYRLCPECRAW